MADAAGPVRARRRRCASRSSGCGGRSTITWRTRAPRRRGAPPGTAPAVVVRRRLWRARCGACTRSAALDVRYRRRRRCTRVRVAARGSRRDARQPARQRVQVGAIAGRDLRPSRTAPTIVITVDDDGPGLPAVDARAVLQRGVRADEAAPGRGWASRSSAISPRRTVGRSRSSARRLAASARCSRCAPTSPPIPQGRRSGEKRATQR